MKARDIFGIIVRTFGLSMTLYAAWYLIYGLATIAGLPEDAEGEMAAYFISGFFCLIVGLYLLKGAPLIMRFCYSERTDS